MADKYSHISDDEAEHTFIVDEVLPKIGTKLITIIKNLVSRGRHARHSLVCLLLYSELLHTERLIHMEDDNSIVIRFIGDHDVIKAFKLLGKELWGKKKCQPTE